MIVPELPRILPLVPQITLINGETFSQSCISQSSPAPTLVWLKDGQLITDPGVTTSLPTPSMAIIVIPAVSKTHIGRYKCVASNSAGAVEETIELHVKGIAN